MRKLAVCYPGDVPTVYAPAFHSMVNLECPQGFSVRWFRGLGWCQARRRTHACEKAIEWGAELIVQLDIDQIYEPDLLCRLTARYDEGYSIIAAAVPLRGYIEESKLPPFHRLAWRMVGDGEDFEPVDLSGTTPVECEFPTSACVLFSVKDLQKLKAPWYFFEYDTVSYKVVKGEDGIFFVRMAKLGVKSYVDPTIRVKHCAVMGIDETFPERFADWTEPGRGDPDMCSFAKDAAPRKG